MFTFKYKHRKLFHYTIKKARVKDHDGRRHTVIIVQLAGGLGNQMQQYALYRKFMSLGVEAKLDASWFDSSAQRNVYAKRTLELSYFKELPMEFCTADEKKRLTGGTGMAAKLSRKLGIINTKEFTETGMYHDDLLSKKDCYIKGYFACEKYYADILPELRKLYVFPEAVDKTAGEKNEEFAREVASDKETGVTPVSIHIRRGDYLDPENAALLGGICTQEYYDGAVSVVRTAVGAAEKAAPMAKAASEANRSVAAKFHFYIFSDDAEYAQKLHFGEQNEQNTVVYWNNGRDSLLDMKLMSLCSANIVANSTFSFWGARLNPAQNKVMVRPSVHKNTQVYDPAQMHELWQNWILVDPKGRQV